MASIESSGGGIISSDGVVMANRADSDAVQEETCILKVPCVTLKDNTERPETLEVESNVLSGVNQNKILEGAKKMLNKQTLRKFDQNASLNWENPFGDGKAGERIIKNLQLRS